MLDDSQIVLRIVVDGANAIPVAMGEASTAVKASTTEMETGFQAAGLAAETAGGRMEYSMTEARHAIRGVGEEIGIRMPRFVSSFLADMPRVGAAMAAAFSTIAIIGLLQVLAEVPEAIQKIIGKLSGWDEEAKKVYAEQIALNHQIIDENIKAADEERRFNEIGLTGSAKLVQEKANLAAHMKDVGVEAGRLGTQITRLKEIQEQFKGVLIFTHPDDREAFNDAVQKLPILKAEYAKLNEELRAAPVQARKLGAEAGGAQSDEADRAAKKSAEERKKNEDLIFKTPITQANEIGKVIEGWNEEQNRMAETYQKQLEQEVESDKKAGADRMRMADEEASEVAAAAGRALGRIMDDDQARVRSGRETAQQSKAIQIEAIDEWAAVQRVKLQQALAVAKSVFGEESIEYKKLIDKMNALDDERANREAKVANAAAAKTKSSWDGIQQTIEAHTRSIAAGQETFGQTMAGIYNQIATSIIVNMEKALLQMIAFHFTEQAMAKESIIHQAGVAAAHTFAQVMKALPFPIDVIVAPIAAAGVFTAVASFGAFEKGGIVPETSMALVHKNEMVLPAGISGMMQRMAAGGGGTSHATHLTFAPTIYGGGPGTREMLRDQSKELLSQIRQMMRSGKLPSP